MGAWSQLYYGTLPYLIVATAAEGKLQFYAILPSTPCDIVPVSEKMDLATPAGRTEAVIAIINLPAAARREGLPAKSRAASGLCVCAAVLMPAAIKSTCQSVVREVATFAITLV